jgi:hypothetical protein
VKVDRLGIVTLVGTFVVSLVILRGGIVFLAGEDPGPRAPIAWDVCASLVVALVACRVRRVLDEDTSSR